jgi:hypothetical protein
VKTPSQERRSGAGPFTFLRRLSDDELELLTFGTVDEYVDR